MAKGETYEEFVEKFKHKKTTDDCYTPPEVMEIINSYVEKKYGFNRENFVRPFYPGGDFENYPYKKDDIVVDNPPFSILQKIVNFYNEHNIKFFLFADARTGMREGACAIFFKWKTIEYENGTINPKYRTEWIKEETKITIDETDLANSSIEISLVHCSVACLFSKSTTTSVTPSIAASAS